MYVHVCMCVCLLHLILTQELRQCEWLHPLYTGSLIRQSGLWETCSWNLIDVCCTCFQFKHDDFLFKRNNIVAVFVKDSCRWGESGVSLTTCVKEQRLTSSHTCHTSWETTTKVHTHLTVTKCQETQLSSYAYQWRHKVYLYRYKAIQCRYKSHLCKYKAHLCSYKLHLFWKSSPVSQAHLFRYQAYLCAWSSQVGYKTHLCKWKTSLFRYTSNLYV